MSLFPLFSDVSGQELQVANPLINRFATNVRQVIKGDNQGKLYTHFLIAILYEKFRCHNLANDLCPG